jgi:branched-chain amino acid transport system substrate-binding protein
MTRLKRRAILQGGAAAAGILAVGFPAILRAQDKIKIGHLTPLTGFLGALGAYAQLESRVAMKKPSTFEAGSLLARGRAGART